MKTTANNIKDGDIFIFDNHEQVATDDYTDQYLWVTNRNYYIQDEDKANVGYGYTSACIIVINKDDIVDIIENMKK